MEIFPIFFCKFSDNENFFGKFSDKDSNFRKISVFFGKIYYENFSKILNFRAFRIRKEFSFVFYEKKTLEQRFIYVASREMGTKWAESACSKQILGPTLRLYPGFRVPRAHFTVILSKISSYTKTY